MATLAFLTMPAHGHINPTLPLVAELARRGERVRYYATDAFQRSIEQTGAEFCSYGSGYALAATQNLGGPFGLMARAIEATEAVLPSLLDQLRADPPDYLILDSLCIWGNLVQQKLALPAVSSCTTFAFGPQMAGRGGPRLPLRQVLTGLPRLLRYWQVAWRVDRRYRTRTPGMLGFFMNRQSLNLVYTSREFQLAGDRFDESYCFVGPSVAPRQDGSDFPWDQVGGGPLIYISMGTIFNDVAAFYRACFAAFADSPYAVILSIGANVDEQALGEPPPNFVVRRHVPQLDVLERAALFVTHGGMNSASEALLAGVPLLVVPQTGDQFFVAGRVAELGAGIPLHSAQATPPRLRALAERLLSEPAFRDAAQRLGEGLRAAGGFQRAADEIFAWKARVGIAG